MLLAAAAAVAAGGGWWASTGGHGASRGEPVVVRIGDLVLSVPVAGTLKAVDSDPIGPPQLEREEGFKISFLAPEGAEVRAGEPVLGFDTSALQRELDRKRAEADQARQEAEKRRAEIAVSAEDDGLRQAEAEAALRRADLKLAVPPGLEAGTVVKVAELDREQASRDVAHLKESARGRRLAAEAEIAGLREVERRAAARVLEIQDAIGRLTVTAPRAGTVIYVTNWRDDKKKVGDTIWRTEAVLEIPDLSRMMAVGQVDEADSGRLAVGQRVTLSTAAHPDLAFKGRLVGVAQAVERKDWGSHEKVVAVEIGLDVTDTMRMRPGMRVVGKVEVGRITGAVLVPVDAVTATPEGPTVLRRTAFGWRETKLRLGERNDETVQVLAGVAPGDTVERRYAGAEATK